jgi:uncharacterized HAD superfamily protein
VSAEKLWVSIDLDNVLAATDPLIRELLASRHGLYLQIENVVEFDYAMCGATREQSDDVLHFFHSKACAAVALEEGASNALLQIQRLYRVRIVTSRPEATRTLTEEWLVANGIVFDELVFTNEKAQLCLGSVALVDDSHANAVDVASAGIPVLLLDKPWNRKPLPDLVQRIFSWPDGVRWLTIPGAGKE